MLRRKCRVFVSSRLAGTASSTSCETRAHTRTCMLQTLRGWVVAASQRAIVSGRWYSHRVRPPVIPIEYRSIDLYILCALTQFRSLAPNNSHRPKLLEDLAPEEVREQVRRHIFTTMGHFRGRIKVWDVVNEALAPNGEFSCIGFGDDAKGRLSIRVSECTGVF